MQIYTIAETETQPSVGDLVDMADYWDSNKIKTYQITDEPESHYSEMDGCYFNDYQVVLFEPHDICLYCGFDNGPNGEARTGCDACNYSGGY